MKVSMKLMVARGFAMAIAALFLLVMVTASAVGQQETGQITGRVVDPQDRVVPGASVTVKSVGTGAERTATADDQGNKKQHQQILDAVTGGSMGGGVKMNPNTGQFSVQAWREGDSDIVLVELAREL